MQRLLTIILMVLQFEKKRHVDRSILVNQFRKNGKPFPSKLNHQRKQHHFKTFFSIALAAVAKSGMARWRLNGPTQHQQAAT